MLPHRREDVLVDRAWIRMRSGLPRGPRAGGLGACLGVDRIEIGIRRDLPGDQRSPVADQGINPLPRGAGGGLIGPARREGGVALPANGLAFDEARPEPVSGTLRPPR